MHSQFKISNSSDNLNLDIGVPSIQKLASDKYTEDFRLYCELTVEAQRLVNLEDERLCNTTETLLVEPHYFNVSCTPLTPEFIAQEKRLKSKNDSVHSRDISKSTEEIKHPFPSSRTERRKSIDKKSVKENTAVRHTDEKRFKDLPAKKPPDLPSSSPVNSSLKLPVLPTTPIPVSELPPDSVRSPPSKLPNMIQALSSLTPIPLKDLNPPAPAKPPTAVPATPDSISIQVPMQGADGTQVMQTINVPKSVLAGASERPVLLTVTPKNGVNKGQKQIVVLTKSANGIGAAVKPHNPVPSSSPSKVVLSQRQGSTGSDVNKSNISTILAASKPVTDINSLLSQVKPVPTSELAKQGYTGIKSTPVMSSSPATSLPKASNLVPVTLPVRQVTVPAPTSSTQIISSQNIIRPVLQQGLAQPTPEQRTQVITQQQQIVQRPQQRIIQQIVRPGQILPNGQQLVIQNGKPVLIPVSAVAGAVSAPSTPQLPQGKIVLTQKGQVIQGAQAQALAGKIINTSQGQFIIGPNGQLISTQKLIQNHLTNQTNQTYKFVNVSQAKSISLQRPVTSFATTVANTSQTTVTVGSPSTQRVSIAIPLVQAVQGNAILPGGVQVLGTQVKQSTAAVRGPTTIQLGSVQSQGIRALSAPTNSVVPASPLAGGSTTIVTSSTVGSTTPDRGTQSSNPAFNQVILNALSNRGLLSQQNGKFVYVGDSKSTVSSPKLATASISPGATVSIPLSSLQQTQDQQNKNLVKVVVSAPNLDSFTASPSLLRMASSLMENPSIAELINTPCETGVDPTRNQNGDINLYGVKSMTKAVSISESKPVTFYYRDPRLPSGWYVSVESNCTGTVIVNYFSPSGDKLRSLSEVAHFLKNKLMILPSCRMCPPPCPVSEIPQLSELSPENQSLVPNIVLPTVDNNSPVIRQIDSEIISPLKRPSSVLGYQDEKKSKIVFF